MKCHNAGDIYIKGTWYCKECGKPPSDKKRRPLTEWEALKLSFYRSEAKWIDHINRRKIVYDQNGRQKAVETDYKGNILRDIPNQPKALWPKPKGSLTS